MRDVLNEKVGIIGLGKLGLPMLAAFIDRGFSVRGYDIDDSLVKELTGRHIRYDEPGLKTIMDNDPEWEARFYSSFSDFLEGLDVLFLIVPTPTVNDVFDRSYIESTLTELRDSLLNFDENVTVVITSTVNPGDTRYLYNKYFNGSKVDLVYSPEFIALGSVLKDMLHPEVVLLGGGSDTALDTVFRIYSHLYLTYPEFHRLSWLEAEVAKIALNSYVTMKISFANMIGAYVKNITSDDSSPKRVLDSIGGDSRVGRKYFKFGGGFGGPCFPRDNRALSKHLHDADIEPFIPSATDQTNDFMINFWVAKIRESNPDAIIFVGVAYKEGTDFIEESFILKLNAILQDHYQTYYIDDKCTVPYLKRLTASSQNKEIECHDSILAVVNYGDCSFISHKELKVLSLWDR